MSHLKEPFYVDSTVRLKWEITREQFDMCALADDSIDSEQYLVKIGSHQSGWFITMYPNGIGEDTRNNVSVTMEMTGTNMPCDVLLGLGLETQAGYWPNGDLSEKLYSGRGANHKRIMHLGLSDKYKVGNWGDNFFCTTQEFKQQFVRDKVTFVATLVFLMEGKRYHQQKEASDNYIENVRSIPLLENLCDITVICRGKHFRSHKVLLAARSKYFEALFRHDHLKKEVNIEEASPEIVETMLEFMAKGLIPSDIDDKALDLVELADMYRIELLSEVCMTSIVNNLSPDNALEAFVIVDKLKHITKVEHDIAQGVAPIGEREKILAYIKKRAAQIVHSDDWKNFYQNHPKLVTEILLSACNA